MPELIFSAKQQIFYFIKGTEKNFLLILFSLNEFNKSAGKSKKKKKLKKWDLNCFKLKEIIINIIIIIVIAIVVVVGILYIIKAKANNFYLLVELYKLE